MKVRIIKPGINQLKKVIKFIPLLILYIIIVLIFSKDALLGDDGGRYLVYADNLLNGFFSPREDVNLWNGPGYPILLVPFLGLHIPLIFAKLLNAVFLFFAVIYFYFLLSLFIRERAAVIFAYLLGLYFPLFLCLHLLLTEVFTVFLICGFMFHFCKRGQGIQGRTNLIASIVFLGYLALTKIFFGYVIITGLVISLLLSLFKLRRIFLFSIPVYFGALVFCIPYLIYSYVLTSKPFYWGTSGGISLYWMAASDKGELGDVYDPAYVLNLPDSVKFASHKKFFNYLVKLPRVQQDEELKKRAIANIKSNPGKFVKNWAANIGRLVFSYPYSYTQQKLSTFFYIIPNMFIVVLFIFSFCLYLFRLSVVPSEIHNLLLFGGITFFGSSLLSAYPRYLFPIIPILFLFIAFMAMNFVKVEFRK